MPEALSLVQEIDSRSTLFEKLPPDLRLRATADMLHVASLAPKESAARREKSAAIAPLAQSNTKRGLAGRPQGSAGAGFDR